MRQEHAGRSGDIEGDPGVGDEEVGAGAEPEPADGEALERLAVAGRGDVQPGERGAHLGVGGSGSGRGGEGGVAPRAAHPSPRDERDDQDRDPDHHEEGSFAGHARTPARSWSTPSTTVGRPRCTVQRTSPGSSRPR